STTGARRPHRRAPNTGSAPNVQDRRPRARHHQGNTHARADPAGSSSRRDRARGARRPRQARVSTVHVGTESMSRVAQSSPNTLTVASDDSATIGTLIVSVAGFIAFTAAGKALGGFTTMDAAMSALENAASSK